MTSVEDEYAELNATLARVVPELASEYAKVPVKYTKWLSPSDVGPKGEPCFVAANATQGKKMKMDYVWCKHGLKGSGYYLLLSKIAYTELYSRLLAEHPDAGCCGMSERQRKVYDDYLTTKAVVDKRFEASRPDILVGEAAARVDAKGTQARRGANFADNDNNDNENNLPTAIAEKVPTKEAS